MCSTQKIFDVLLDVGFKLGRNYKTVYSCSYAKYTTSISDLYQQIKTYLDEEGGITTPTNIKSFESLTSVSSNQQNDNRNGNSPSSLEELEDSCQTPVHNSLTVSPNEEISFVSTKSEHQSSLSNIIKVSHHT